MKLRKYTPDDCAEMADLFYHTVHTVNAGDYTEAQLAAWATGKPDLSGWNASFSAHHTVVAQAESGGTIIGFGDMDDGGYLDRLYVHKDFQHRGIATAILGELEREAARRGVARFTTYASITAKPFFERRGYRTVRENTVIRAGIALTNYLMEK